MSIIFENSNTIIFKDDDNKSYKNYKTHKKRFIKTNTKKKIPTLKSLDGITKNEFDEFLTLEKILTNDDPSKFYDKKSGCCNLYNSTFELTINEIITKLKEHISGNDVFIYDPFKKDDSNSIYAKLFKNFNITTDVNKSSCIYDIGFNNIWCDINSRFSINIFDVNDFVRLSEEECKKIITIYYFKIPIFNYDTGEFVICISCYSSKNYKHKNLITISDDGIYRKTIEVDFKHIEEILLNEVDAMDFVKSKYNLNEYVSDVDTLKHVLNFDVNRKILNKGYHTLTNTLEFCNEEFSYINSKLFTLSDDDLIEVCLSDIMSKIKINGNKLNISPDGVYLCYTNCIENPKRSKNFNVSGIIGDEFILIDSSNDFIKLSEKFSFDPKYIKGYKFNRPINTNKFYLSILAIQLNALNFESQSVTYSPTERLRLYKFFDCRKHVRQTDKIIVHINKNYLEGLDYSSPVITSEISSSEEI